LRTGSYGGAGRRKKYRLHAIERQQTVGTRGRRGGGAARPGTRDPFPAPEIHSQQTSNAWKKVPIVKGGKARQEHFLELERLRGTRRTGGSHESAGKQEREKPTEAPAPIAESTTDQCIREGKTIAQFAPKKPCRMAGQRRAPLQSLRGKRKKKGGSPAEDWTFAPP